MAAHALQHDVIRPANGIAQAIVVITTISAAIMELIDTSIVNVALSQIAGNLGATIEDTSWVVTAYAIANVIIIPLTGFLARYFGRKNYYIASTILFTVASFACGNASGLWELVFFRFVQGIGGGALLSTSQAILFDAYPPEKRAIAGGLFGMGIVLGPTIGPTLGGYIVDNYNWQLIFNINIPFGIVAVILASNFVIKQPWEYVINKAKIHIDYLGIALLALGIGSLQYVLERGQSDDWFEDEYIRYLSVTTLVGLGGFIYRQLTEKEPLIDLRILNNRNLAVANIMNFVVGFGLFGSVFIFPVMVQRIMGYTPMEAGLSMIPGSLVAIFVMPITGRALASGKVQPLFFVGFGFVCFLLYTYLSAQMTPDAGRADFFIPQLLRGLGTATLMAPLTNLAAAGLTPQKLPYGIALTNMIRQLGGAFGIALMNTYITRRYAIHRVDLVSNTVPGTPQFDERVRGLQNLLISKGYTAQQALEAAYRQIDGMISRQAFMVSYLDGFLLIGLFFVFATPLMFLLRRSRISATEAKALADSDAH